MIAEKLPPAYTLWPPLPGLDAPALYAAERKAMEVLRSWHFVDGADVTLFDGVSLGRGCRYGMVLPVMSLFRQAALGTAIDSPRIWNTGLEGKYALDPFGDLNAVGTRREDPKARAFRLVARLIGATAPRASTKRLLVVGSPSNRGLWSEWLSRPETRRTLALDFSLQQPPGLSVAWRALRHGARMFDPAPVELTAVQTAQAEKIRQSLERLPKSADWRKLFDVGGRDVSAPFVERVLSRVIAQIPDRARRCAAFDAELQRLKPDAVLLPNEVGNDPELFLRLSHRRGVRTILLNHGFPCAGYRFDEAAHCGELETDMILAWSDGDRANYENRGAPAARLVVTGNPAFDELPPTPPARAFRGVSGATVMILPHSSLAGIRAVYRDDDEERAFLEITALLDRLGAGRLLFKLHPGVQRPEFYARLRDQQGLKTPIEILKEERFLDVLSRADFVVGSPSTAIFETLLAGKEYFLVSYAPLRIPEPFDVAHSYVAKATEELERNLRDGNAVPREKILREFCDVTGAEGRQPAARRVLETISRELSR